MSRESSSNGIGRMSLRLLNLEEVLLFDVVEFSPKLLRAQGAGIEWIFHQVDTPPSHLIVHLNDEAKNEIVSRFELLELRGIHLGSLKKPNSQVTEIHDQDQRIWIIHHSHM